MGRRFWAGMVAALFGLGAAAPAAAQDDAAMQEAISALESALKGELLNNPYTTRWSTEGNGVRGKVVRSDTAPGGAAFEVSVKRSFQNAWEGRVTVPLEKDIEKGDMIEVSIYLRAEKLPKSMQAGNVDLQVVRTREPYDNIMSENIRPGSDWQLYTVRGVAGRDFDADQTVFGVNMGSAKQTLQLGSVYVVRKQQ
ncbi:hypothetical protein HK107_04000 [Parvularcula sp. ZS-1/3]|uniref:Uncharacterized protein n=1 Tax=Parvularcula mediterranea TaxID=2732508 RepID=A0A7Y3RK05_9PROT|nr:hypothetical protein [Parvularcula mediterranea]NNU15483.1 hypothetical protein [Parvularcula mediterranea]